MAVYADPSQAQGGNYLNPENLNVYSVIETTTLEADICITNNLILNGVLYAPCDAPYCKDGVVKCHIVLCT